MKNLKISGITIHSGIVSNIIVKPKKSGGIIFVRNGAEIPAVYKNVHVSGLRNTTIGQFPNNVQTIEHLMASLFVCGITNAKIIIDNVEPPILDGGAEEFIKQLESLKTKEKRHFLVVKKEIIARQSEIKMPWFIRINNFIRGRKQSDRFVKLSPTQKQVLEIDARLVYPDKIIGEQSVSFTFDYDKQTKSQKSFLDNISMCRTFGTVAEWEWLKKHGMGRGANEYNVIALGTVDEMSELQKMGIGKKIKKKDMFFPKDSMIGALTGLHYRNEFVRHKIIDTVGDLYTSGYSMIAKVESNKGSHALNNLVLKKLFSDKSNYDII